MTDENYEERMEALREKRNKAVEEEDTKMRVYYSGRIAELKRHHKELQ